MRDPMNQYDSPEADIPAAEDSPDPRDGHTLDPAASYQKSDFASFNFDTIWKMKDGRPVLRIFEE